MLDRLVLSWNPVGGYLHFILTVLGILDYFNVV